MDLEIRISLKVQYDISRKLFPIFTDSNVQGDAHCTRTLEPLNYTLLLLCLTYFHNCIYFFERGIEEKENVIQLMNFLAWFGGPRLELQVSTRDHAEYIF